MNNDNDGMTKYAVDESGSDFSRSGKVAQQDLRCPLCGARCMAEGSVILCPRHGSAPFERG